MSIMTDFFRLMGLTSHSADKLVNEYGIDDWASVKSRRQYFEARTIRNVSNQSQRNIVATIDYCHDVLGNIPDDQIVQRLLSMESAALEQYLLTSTAVPREFLDGEGTGNQVEIRMCTVQVTDPEWTNNQDGIIHRFLFNSPHDSDEMSEYSYDDQSLKPFFLALGITEAIADAICSEFDRFSSLYAEYSSFESQSFCLDNHTMIIPGRDQLEIARAIAYCERKWPHVPNADHYLDLFMSRNQRGN